MAFPCFCRTEKYSGVNTEVHADKLTPLETLRQLRGGLELKRCAACGTHWLLDPVKHWMERLDDQTLAETLRWEESDNSLPGRIANALPGLASVSWDGREIYPCSVVFKDGKRSDYCLLIFSDEHPDNYYGELRFLHEVERISPSPYALPSDLIMATRNAEEVRMMVCPTVLLTPGGAEVVIYNTVFFLNSQGLKGSEMRLGDGDWKKAHSLKYPVKNDKIVAIWGDALPRGGHAVHD